MGKKEQDVINIEFTLDKVVFSKDGFVIARVFSKTNEIRHMLNPIYANVSIKGTMPKLRPSIVYKASVISQEENKYGYTLTVSNVYPRDFNSDSINSDEEMVSFVEMFIGEGTANKLRDVKGICNMIKEKDIKSLTKIYGVGEKLAEKLTKTYDFEAVGSKYLLKIKKLGFTDNEIKKLGKLYDDNLLSAYEQIKTNIFSLVFKGFQLGRMDVIFLEKLEGDKKDKRRIKCYIWKGLRDFMYDGYKSYATLDQFYHLDIIRNITANVGEDVLNDCIKQLEKDKEIKIMDGKLITTYEQWTLENDLIKLIDELSNFKADKLPIKDIEAEINEQEEIIGFKLNEGQREAVKSIVMSESCINMLNGYAGCVDMDTEYFNGKEWVKMSDYQEGDKVLSYYADGSAKLVDPIRYVKVPQENMTIFKNKIGSINQCLSDGHNFVYRTSKGKINYKTFDQVKNKHINSKLGFNGKVISAFNYSGRGIDLTDAEIKVMTMVIADGSFPRNTNRCYVNLKKERKIRRAYEILNEANIEYEVTDKINGYKLFKFYAPRREKEFTEYWYDCNNRQFKIITDECLKWDGSISSKRNRFFTMNKNTANFIQFAYSSQNKRCKILEYKRDGKIEYSLSFTHELDLGMRARRIEDKIEMKDFKTKDGYQYCFEVESHMLVLRRGNQIFITGNTGKTTVTRVILNIYNKYNYSNFMLCALSGRASSILGESSGYEECAKTIHRTLGMAMGGDRKWYFDYNHKFPHTDVECIDEISMIDYGMLYSILAPSYNGMKIILLGDNGQLPSLSFGNTIDTLKLFNINVNELTQVMRQSKDAYILKVANDVRNGKNPFENTKYKWYGEDVEVCIGDSYNYMINSFIEKYKEDPKSSIVVTTTKQTTDRINFDIQECLIDEGLINIKNDYITKPSSTKGRIYKMYIGDYVMILKNNYNCIDYTGRDKNDFYVDEVFENEDEIIGTKTAIYNGEIYMIKDIFEKYVILTDGEMDIVVETALLECQLAYCSNVHKMQGSGFPNVFVYHTSSYVDKRMMVSKQWLYTAYTRAKKFLSIHTDEFTNLKMGVDKDAIDEKVTICEYLKTT